MSTMIVNLFEHSTPHSLKSFVRIFGRKDVSDTSVWALTKTLN